MILVELDIYSGRQNPVFILRDDASRWLQRETADRQSDTCGEILGFRGIRLSPLSDHTPIRFSGNEDLYISASGAALSRNLEIISAILEKIPSDSGISDELTSYLRSNMAQVNQPTSVMTSSFIEGTQQAEATAYQACKCEVQPFNPAFWNTSPYILQNNCYNYATNRRTNTFAQPGRATGVFPYPMACDRVRAAAISDGAKWGSSPSGFALCQPDSENPRWFMAMVVWPGQDYHWYRMNTDRTWGHKPGHTAAKITDNSGRTITNPETCDRGPYTNFCGYFLSGKSSRIN